MKLASKLAFALAFTLAQSLLPAGSLLPAPPLAGSQTTPGHPALNGLTEGCRFGVPAGISAARAEYIGDCKDGVAEGFGGIRMPLPGGAANTFVGRFHAGAPVSGMLLVPNGWEIWDRFDANLAHIANRSGEASDTIHACENGSTGARRLSAFYKARGNAASAAFYADQAKRLQEYADHF